MQIIQITSLTGHSPYDITICDITNTYCYSGVTGATTAPLTIDIPTELLGTTELLVVVTDSIGCQEIQYHFCGEPIPSQTPTPTPTITPTNSICNCIAIENTSGITLNFGFTQCDGTLFYGEIYSATTLYVCGSLPYGDSGVVITISSDICTGDVCPGPSPTPTTTPTPTPTLPPIVGYFEDSCDSSNQFTLSDIPISFSPLSGVYYIESSGFIGCATSVISSSTLNVYSFIAMGSQPNIYHCQKANFIYPCPTLTPTPSITPTHTPTPTVTMTVTPTHTPTNTPTPSTNYGLFLVISCCDRSIVKVMSLPSHFLPGLVIVSNDGYCYQIRGLTSSLPVSEYWNHGTTYPFCEPCIYVQTCTPTISPFISVWVTTTPSESIMLPYETTGSYSGTIDWGDGTTSINSYANRAHTYTTPGTYTITITGTLIGWSFGVNPISKGNISEILQWGCLRLGNSGAYFQLCGGLSLSNVTDVLNLTGTNSLYAMFGSCSSITNIPNINSWDTSNITDMAYMFSDCQFFDDNIGNWDVSNVQNMFFMFGSSLIFNNGGSDSISDWDTSSVTNMRSMFQETTIFNQPLSGWNVSNVTNMFGMFELSYLFNQPLDNWDVGNVTNMSGVFISTSFNQPIGSWDVSNVTDMSYMFNSSPFNQDINSWDVSNVTNMLGMFGNTIFNQPLSGWNVSNVTTFSNMFRNSIFNQPINSWNVSNSTNFREMFRENSVFNQPLNSWVVSAATNMELMFAYSTSFNQNIGSWDVRNVSNFFNFMLAKTNLNYSTTNLDLIYNGWSSLPSVQSGVNINFGTIKYTAGGSAGKTILQGTYGWTITDGGI
jgi:surface protein